jgi:hypothetical protein
MYKTPLYALAPASRQRRHAAPQLKVPEPDFTKEFQPLANLRKDVPRDLGGASLKFQGAEKVIRAGNRQL